MLCINIGDSLSIIANTNLPVSGIKWRWIFIPTSTGIETTLPSSISQTNADTSSVLTIHSATTELQGVYKITPSMTDEGDVELSPEMVQTTLFGEL